MGAAIFLKIEFFGAMRVCVGDEMLPPLRSRKGLWVLALLALRHGRDVDREWLAGTLWIDSSPTQALANLRLTLTDLRKALGAEASERLLSPTPHTLRLDLAGADVDIVEFDAAVKRGDTASLERAVGIYKGMLMEGCTEEWVIPERAVREQAYLKCLETLAAHADPKAAIGYLRAILTVDPLQEGALRTLMQALSAEGDYPAATVAYRNLRLYLHQELNAAPDPETTALFHRLRAESRRKAQSASAPSVTVHAPMPLPTGVLPRPLTNFIGREKEVAEIVACLSKARLVTLTGTGGVGKTRLAVRVMEELAIDYPDGVWFVDLATLSDAALVPQTAATVLGVAEEPGRLPLQALRDNLKGKALLLTLDNCEHLSRACAELASALLMVCPHLRILATSRRSLGVAGETVARISPLDISALIPPVSPERLPDCEAVQLFTDRAVAASSSFAVTPQNAPAVAEICSRLDGIPLALELAAARVSVLPVEQIASRLADRFRLLTNGDQTRLPRQQTLQALIDWSYELLSEAERTLLNRLSVFAGGWTLEAAEIACAGRGIEETKILDLLAALIDRSLVVYREINGEARYSLLETLRQYAAAWLNTAGETEAMRSCHQNFFVGFSEEAEPHLVGAEQALWLARIEREQDNIRAALAWSVEGEGHLRLVSALIRFWYIRGRLSEGRSWLKSGLAGRGDLSAALRAKALNGAGTLAWGQGDYDAARHFYEEALVLRRAKGDPLEIAGSLGNLGLVARNQGDLTSAALLMEEALALERQVGDTEAIAISLGNLGLVAFDQGNYDSAKPLLEESLSLKRKTGDKWGITIALNNLGLVAWKQRRMDAAQSLQEESLALYRELEDKRGVATTLGYLALIACDREDFTSARLSLQQSFAIGMELGEDAMLIGWMVWATSLKALEGHAEQACYLLGAVEKRIETGEILMTPNDRADYDRDVAIVRAQLSAEVFATAWEHGRTMTLNEALALAQSEPSSL